MPRSHSNRERHALRADVLLPFWRSFLSHYKVEAGSDARYLSDLIRRMTGCPAYLDSTDLVDFRALFAEGVNKSEVLVILATQGVFTRPWCLMEMWEAALNQVPIVIFPVSGGCWSSSDTRMLLSDLTGQMPTRNASCMADLMVHMKKQGVTDVQEVEDVLLVHVGLVSTLAELERRGRPASAERDKQLCARLKKADITELGSWLAAHNAAVEQRLQFLSWQSWGAAVGQKSGLASLATPPRVSGGFLGSGCSHASRITTGAACKLAVASGASLGPP